jgi:hypothetical protein
MTRMTGDLLVVGSVPLASAEEVFRTLAGELGSFLDAYPDGETGDRSFWTFYLPTRTYSQHPDLIDVNRPEGGRVRQLLDVRRPALRRGCDRVLRGVPPLARSRRDP